MISLKSSYNLLGWRLRSKYVCIYIYMYVYIYEKKLYLFYTFIHNNHLLGWKGSITLVSYTAS